jgi:antitoxin YefM
VAQWTIFLVMRTLPLSAVKARLSEIADEVDRTHERVYVTRNGRDYVVLMAIEDLESLEATLELLADPEAMARLRDAEAQVAAGEVTSEEEMAALMENRRRGRAARCLKAKSARGERDTDGTTSVGPLA